MHCLELNESIEVIKDTTRFFNNFEIELRTSLTNLLINNFNKMSIETYNSLSAADYLSLFLYSNENINLSSGTENVKQNSQNNLLQPKKSEFNSSADFSTSQNKEYSLISKDVEESHKSIILYNKKMEKEFLSESNKTTLDSNNLKKELRSMKQKILPEQIIFLNDWENFTTAIKNHIQEKKLNKLRGEILKKKNELINILKENNFNLPKRMIENAIERYIWKEEILKQLVMKKISTIEDFEWKKQPKYHIVEIYNNENEEKIISEESKNESKNFKLFFTLGDLTMEYGYELLPSGESCKLSSLGFLNVFRDKCFLTFSNCLKMKKSSLIINNKFIENTVLAFGQFCGLPITISSPQNEGRSLSYYSDFLIKCLEFGGLHLFKGLEREMNPEFLDAIMNILELVEDAFNLNKQSLELFDQSINISKRFLFIGNFDGSNTRLKTPSKEHLTQLKTRFREVSIYKLELTDLLKLIFIKKGFSTGESLANKLFVLINELEELADLTKSQWSVDIKSFLSCLDHLYISNGDHSIEHEKVLDVINKYWFKQIGLSSKQYKEFYKEAQTILLRKLNSQTEIKERIEFELENISVSESGSLQMFNQVINDLTAAYGFDKNKAISKKIFANKMSNSKNQQFEKVYKTTEVNKLESQTKIMKRIQSNDKKINEEVDQDSQFITEEDNLKNKEIILECLKQSDNLLKMKGQEKDMRPIMICGEVFSGKSQTLANFQRIIDSERKGKTRVTRIFPGVHDFDDLFGKSQNISVKNESLFEDNKKIQEIYKRKRPFNRESRNEDEDSEDEENHFRNSKSDFFINCRLQNQSRFS
jgi:hypothetical protein